MLLREHEMAEQAEELKQGKATEIGLEYCEIGDDGLEIIARFLKGNETVKKIHLRYSNIGLRGIKALTDALKHNKSVEHLDIAFNDIGEEGAEALIDVLNENVCLLDMWVSGNGFSPESISIIKHLTQLRNQMSIPNAVRSASLCLIAARRRTISGAGDFEIIPIEIVKMIARQVWDTRKDPIWIEALSAAEPTAKLESLIYTQSSGISMASLKSLKGASPF